MTVIYEARCSGCGHVYAIREQGGQWHDTDTVHPEHEA